MSDFRISIPKPCHEDWNSMTSEETGRFCGSCAKTVVDFTQMLPDQVQHYFTQHQNQRICGRFKSAQLNIIDITIPESVLYRKRSFRKAMLLALFVVMGNTLFSCKNDRMLGEVQVVSDTIKKETPHHNDTPEKPFTDNIKIGESDHTTPGTLPVSPPPPPPPTPKINEVKFTLNSKKIVYPKIISGDVVIEPVQTVKQEEVMGMPAIIPDTISKK